MPAGKLVCTLRERFVTDAKEGDWGKQKYRIYGVSDPFRERPMNTRKREDGGEGVRHIRQLSSIKSCTYALLETRCS